jgi:hypothetical protein
MNFLRRISLVKRTVAGMRYLHNPEHLEGMRRSSKELAKSPSRIEIINFLISCFDRSTMYLEISVRNPDHNFNPSITLP